MHYDINNKKPGIKMAWKTKTSSEKLFSSWMNAGKNHLFYETRDVSKPETVLLWIEKKTGKIVWEKKYATFTVSKGLKSTASFIVYKNHFIIRTAKGAEVYTNQATP